MNPIEIKTNNQLSHDESLSKANSINSSVNHSAKNQTQTQKTGFNLSKRKNRHFKRKGW